MFFFSVGNKKNKNLLNCNNTKLYIYIILQPLYETVVYFKNKTINILYFIKNLTLIEFVKIPILYIFILSLLYYFSFHFIFQNLFCLFYFNFLKLYNFTRTFKNCINLL